MRQVLWIVIIASAFSVVNGQETKAHRDTDKGQAAAGGKDTSNASRGTILVINQQTAQGQQDGHLAKSPSYFHELLLPANLINLALVAVGFAGIGIALKSLKRVDFQIAEMRRQVDLNFGQLRAMHEQITEMSQQTASLKEYVADTKTIANAGLRSANAAKTSADIAASVSVPTLAIEKFENGLTGAANISAFLQYPRVKIVVKNYGQTPAFLKWWAIIFSCENLPDVPDYEGYATSGMILDKVVVEPQKSYTLPELGFPYRQEISLEDVHSIIARGKLLRAYGFICYGDLFGNPLRRLKFCETALNICGSEETPFWIQWVSSLAPAIYEGIEQFPFKKPISGERTESETMNAETKEEQHPKKAN